MDEYVVELTYKQTTDLRKVRRERIVRCLDCTRCARVGDMAYCHHFRLYVPPRGFCWAGEPR